MNKKYKEKALLVNRPCYPVGEAIELLERVSTTAFDGSAEVHIRLGTDTKSGDQQVRSTVNLPHGTGKNLVIAAVVPEDMAKEVKDAGASAAGVKNLVSDMAKGNMNFDVLIAVPSVMKELGKVAKLLGPKGLMPNPKAGTVTDDPIKTIQELRKGRVEIRADKQGIIHSVFGRISFGKEKLLENLQSLMQAVKDAKPASLKGDYIKSITVCPSMGPGIRIDIGSV